MGTRLYGCVAAQNPDSVNEIISLDGLQDNLKYIRDEHDSLDFFHIIGSISYSKKLYKESDCENPKQLRVWNQVKVPLLYAEGELFDDQDHPNAKAAASVLKYCAQNDVALKPGFSVDGSILERQDASGNVTDNKSAGKHLTRTIATSGALTVQPCNQKCAGAIFLENDLQKSSAVEPSGAYFEALAKSQPLQSFSEVGDGIVLLYSLQKLKKALTVIDEDHKTLQCHKCGSAERFFKSSKCPNTCYKCGEHYTMKQIWESLNK